jgi:hypothetical protein
VCVCVCVFLTVMRLTKLSTKPKLLHCLDFTVPVGSVI